MKASYSQYTERVLGKHIGGMGTYKERVQRLATDGCRILHAGCGWDKSEVTAPLKDRCEVVGVDRDPSVADRYHSEFWLADLAALPFPDASFDLICSEMVFEHIEMPHEVLSELHRVMKPGATLIAVTPSLWSYKSLAAAVVPSRFHAAAVRVLRRGTRDAADVYPTRYRLNTAGAVRRYAGRLGMDADPPEFISNGPTWFARLPGLFEVGRAYHAALEAIELFAPLRCNMIITMRRRSEVGSSPRT